MHCAVCTARVGQIRLMWNQKLKRNDDKTIIQKERQNIDGKDRLKQKNLRDIRLHIFYLFRSRLFITINVK